MLALSCLFSLFPLQPQAQLLDRDLLLLDLGSQGSADATAADAPVGEPVHEI